MKVISQLHAPSALSQEKIPGSHSVEGWVGPRAGLDAAAKRKIPSPWRESNPDHSACRLNAIRTELSRFRKHVEAVQNHDLPKVVLLHKTVKEIKEIRFIRVGDGMV
jgi:hypothetical protein